MRVRTLTLLLLLALSSTQPAAGQSIRDQIDVMSVTYTNPACKGFVVSVYEDGWDFTGNSYAVFEFVMGEFPEYDQILYGTKPRIPVPTTTGLRVYVYITDGQIDGDISQGCCDQVRHVYVRVLDHSLSAFDAGMRLFDTCK